MESVVWTPRKTDPGVEHARLGAERRVLGVPCGPLGLVRLPMEVERALPGPGLTVLSPVGTLHGLGRAVRGVQRQRLEVEVGVLGVEDERHGAENGAQGPGFAPPAPFG